MKNIKWQVPVETIRLFAAPQVDTTDLQATPAGVQPASAGTAPTQHSFVESTESASPRLTLFEVLGITVNHQPIPVYPANNVLVRVTGGKPMLGQRATFQENRISTPEKPTLFEMLDITVDHQPVPVHPSSNLLVTVARGRPMLGQRATSPDSSHPQAGAAVVPLRVEESFQNQTQPTVTDFSQQEGATLTVVKEGIPEELVLEEFLSSELVESWGRSQ